MKACFASVFNPVNGVKLQPNGLRALEYPVAKINAKYNGTARKLTLVPREVSSPHFLFPLELKEWFGLI